MGRAEHRAHRELSKAEVANVRLYEFTPWIKPTVLCLSGRREAERHPLLRPLDRERSFKVGKLQRCRRRAVQDGFDDVGRQQGQPDRPREIGPVDALFCSE
jgi:hypothetical protein